MVTPTPMREKADGMFIAECPSITGCVSQGRTAEEAQVNVQDAVRECLEGRAEKGLPLTVMTRQVEVHVCPSPATLSVPNHRQVARGTLRSLIARADLTVDEFV